MRKGKATVIRYLLPGPLHWRLAVRCRRSEVVGQIGAGSPNAGGERSLYLKGDSIHAMD